MIIAGLQKLTLLDYPDKTACTIFISGCNFKCPYCYNISLIKSDEQSSSNISEREIFDFLKTRKGKLDAVCISGGEPTMFEEIVGFAGEIKEMGFQVKIDTNGSNPDMLRKLIKSGNVDYVAMDIKNTPEKYPVTIGVPDYDISPIKESISYLLSHVVSYEFRTTVVKDFHTKDDLLLMANIIKGTDKYFLQGFDGLKETLATNLNAYSETEMKELCRCVREILPCTELRGI